MINYVSLIEQKQQLIKKLRDLDAQEFGATTSGQMDRISAERKDIRLAISAVDNQLNPDLKNGNGNKD